MLTTLVNAVLVMCWVWAGPVTAAHSTQQPARVAQAVPDKPWPPPGVARLGEGVTAPRLVKDYKPRYTPEAMDAKLSGTVLVEAVVKIDGTVGDVRVTRSLDREFGLDDEAVKSVKRWTFKPGTKDGEPVPVVVEIELTFTTR